MEDCIEWEGGRTAAGYGRTTVDGVKWYTHRLAWTEAHGPIPDGMYVCHRCDNPPCHNVEHLFLGTNADNQRDRVAKGRFIPPRKEVCKRGHPMTPDNVYERPNGKRNCRTCRRYWSGGARRNRERDEA